MNGVIWGDLKPEPPYKCAHVNANTMYYADVHLMRYALLTS